MMKTMLLWTSVALLTACAAHQPTTSERIEVYQHDGSRQCEGGGSTPAAMQAQLHGITVYAASKGQLTGVAFPAVCGGTTGNINIYTIAKKDLPAAQQRGFNVLPAQQP